MIEKLKHYGVGFSKIVRKIKNKISSNPESILNTVNIFFVGFCLFSILALGFLGIYGAIESGALTLQTLPLWVWQNGTVFYWFIAAISVGHCAASVIGFESSQKKRKTKKQREDEAAGVLVAIVLAGVIWPAYFSFLIFRPLYKQIEMQKKENKKGNG